MIFRYILFIAALALPVLFLANQATVGYYRKKNKVSDRETDKSVVSLGCGIVVVWIFVVILLAYTQFSYMDANERTASSDSDTQLTSLHSEDTNEPLSSYNGPQDDADERPKKTPPEPSAQVYHDLHMLFEGNPSENRIKSLFKDLMSRYQMPNTESSVRRIGSVLIEQRHRSEMIDFSEIALIKHMLKYGAEGVGFDEQAAISAGALGKTDLMNHNRKYEDPTVNHEPQPSEQF